MAAAIEAGHLSKIKELLKLGAEIESRDAVSNTAALHPPHSSIVERFMHVQAGNTLLHLAAAAGHVEVVEFFMGSGIDPTTVNKVRPLVVGCGSSGQACQPCAVLLRCRPARHR